MHAIFASHDKVEFETVGRKPNKKLVTWCTQGTQKAEALVSKANHIAHMGEAQDGNRFAEIHAEGRVHPHQC